MTPPDASNPWRDLGLRSLRALAVYAALVGSQVYRELPRVGYGPMLATIAWQTGAFALSLAILCLFARSLQPDLASRRAEHERAQGPLKKAAPFLASGPRGGGGS